VVAAAVMMAAVGWLSYQVAQLVLSGRWWLMLLSDLAPPLVFVAVPLLLAGLAPLAWRHWWRVLMLAGLALLLGAPQAGLNPAVLWRDPPPVPAEALRVVSWNTNFWHQHQDPEHFYRYLRSFDADVYLLQEYLYFTDRPVPIDDLAGLRAAFPGYQLVAASELVTLSRLPIESSAALDGSRWLSPETGSAPPPGTDFLPYWTTKTLRTDVRHGGTLLSLYNVHIPVQVDAERSPLTRRFYTVIEEQAARRDAAWRALTDDLAANPLPTLVAGDFNSTPSMGELRRLDRWVRRADPTEGSIYPTSWDDRGPAMLWRLDFVFHTPRVNLHRYTFHHSQHLSDHPAQDLRVSIAATGRLSRAPPAAPRG
jgi:endonuclease/exonuclease/phosphatase (EEP) superfamily protein YafD